jgi:hypothetical protein
MLDDDLQTVGEKGNLDVSIGAVFQRMINGAYAEFTLERRSASAARSAHGTLGSPAVRLERSK